MAGGMISTERSSATVVILCGRPAPPYYQAMDVTLPPDLERFATEAIAAGRFRDRDELVAAGIALLRQAEAEHAAFVRSLEEAEAEGERDGFVPAEQVHRDMRAMLDEMAHAKA